MKKERLDSMPDLIFSFLDSGDDGAEEGFDAGSMYAIGGGSGPQQPAAQATADDPMVFGNLDEVADADASTDNDAAVSGLYEDPMDDYQPAPATTAPAMDPEPAAAPADSTVDDQPAYVGGVDPSFTSLDPIDDPEPTPSVAQQPAAMQPQYSRPSQPQYQQPVPAPAAPQYSQPAQPASPAGYAQPQHTVPPVVSSMMSHSVSTGDIQLDLIKKIIAVVDVYRHLDQASQRVVKEFLDTLSKIGRAPAVDDSEAGVIKAVIEVDPDMREGVVDLMNARNKGGSERAFFLFGMSARRLENMDLILQMLSLSDGSLKVNDSIDSIRQASLTIDTCLNEKFRGDSEAFLKPVYDVLKETQKIMEG